MLINKRREARVKPARQLPTRLYGHEATVLDVSRSGCRLEVALPDGIIPAEDSQVEAAFDLDGRVVVVPARVIYYRGRGRAGPSHTRYHIAVEFRQEASAVVEEVANFVSGSPTA